MKLIKSSLFSLMSLMAISLSSCMDSSEYTPTGGGIAEVKQNFTGYTSFKDVAGFTIDPIQSSVSVLETSMGFKPSLTKIAYILYSYENVGNETMLTDKKVKNASMSYAVSLDGQVERVEQEGAVNDSVATAPIIKLRSLIPTTDAPGQELFLHEGRYLMTGVEYYFYSKRHYLTMVYYPNEQVTGKLILHLRHSGELEADNVYTTSYGAFQSGLPQVYIKSFDIQQYMGMITPDRKSVV